jgi:hypothetical protein
VRVSIDPTDANFQQKLSLLAKKDPILHNQLVTSLGFAVGLDWDDFVRDYEMCVHPSPHFFQNNVFGHFVPAGLSGQIEIYAEVETQNDMLTGHITLICFWKPPYLMP